MKKKLPRPSSGLRDAKEQALQIGVRQLVAKGSSPAEMAEELGQSEKLIEEMIQRLRAQSIYTNQDLRVENLLVSYLQRLQLIDSATWQVIEESDDVWQKRALLLDLRTSLHKSLKEVVGTIRDLLPPPEPERIDLFDGKDFSKVPEKEFYEEYAKGLRKAMEIEEAREK